MANGEVRWDETHRFQLVMQPDGNLVVYAHVIAPNIQRIPIGATGTDRLGPNTRLELDPSGVLYLLVGHKIGWFMPYDQLDPLIPRGTPNSVLHLQADGHLVLYKPGPIRSPDDATWAIGGVSPEVAARCVIPGVVILDVSGGGTISAEFDKQVFNDGPDTIGVRDGRTFVALPPGGHAGVATSGTVAVSAYAYDFVASGPGSGSASAMPSRIYGPTEHEIRATGSRSNFRLA